MKPIIFNFNEFVNEDAIGATAAQPAPDKPAPADISPFSKLFTDIQQNV